MANIQEGQAINELDDIFDDINRGVNDVDEDEDDVEVDQDLLEQLRKDLEDDEEEVPMPDEDFQRLKADMWDAAIHKDGEALKRFTNFSTLMSDMSTEQKKELQDYLLVLKCSTLSDELVKETVEGAGHLLTSLGVAGSSLGKRAREDNLLNRSASLSLTRFIGYLPPAIICALIFSAHWLGSIGDDYRSKRRRIEYIQGQGSSETSIQTTHSG